MAIHLARIERHLRAGWGTDSNVIHVAFARRTVGHWSTEPSVPSTPEERAWRARQARARAAELHRRREASFGYRRAKLVAASTSAGQPC